MTTKLSLSKITAKGPLHWGLAAADRLVVLEAIVAGACFIGLTALIASEMVLRISGKFSDVLPHSLPFAWELASYMMAVIFTFGLGMALRTGTHVRVNILMARLPKPLKRLLEIALSLVFASLLAWFAYTMVLYAINSHKRNILSTIAGFPVYIPQLLIAAGFTLASLQGLARTVRLITGLSSEDHSYTSATLD